MDQIYIIIVILLFCLAISDLVVGVSNDAVNFLNSAIGSKAASFRVIMIVGALGIIFGATFSQGMMEVARKGIFHPEMFNFREIMIIFIAVMMTDIILLDLFNTMGLPTSTTVSIVFELLGAAVAVSFFKILESHHALSDIGEFINSEKALQIIFGILLSVFIAFTIGAIIQYLIRLTFSFKYARRLKYFSALWGGIALTAIIYFMLIKGIKGSSFSDKYVEDLPVTEWAAYLETKSFSDYQSLVKALPKQDGSELTTWRQQLLEYNEDNYQKGVSSIVAWANQAENNSIMVPLQLKHWALYHSMLIMLVCFVFWTIFFQVMILLFKANILKIIVLVGTFALAMAFASNDLVNFIGVPLAGFDSYKLFSAQGALSDTQFTMESLKNPVMTKPYFLIGAGIIMVITLWLSKKARSVIKTTIDLSRQSDGDERFQSNVLSRGIVNLSVNTAKAVDAIMPQGIKNWIQKQFEKDEYESNDKPAFDLVRASVNLVVASILISIGTSLKIPLSTTYVTFMVAMGTSLSDRAWGRESAVYRISGVLTVIGGWFVTAMIAFTVAFILASLIYHGDIYALAGLIALTVFFVVRTHLIHKNKSKEQDLKSKIENELITEKISLYDRCNNSLITSLDQTSVIFGDTVEALGNEELKKLKKAGKSLKTLFKDVILLKNTTHKAIKHLHEDHVDTGYYYVQVLDHLTEFMHSVRHVYQPLREYVDNNHPPLLDTQIDDLKSLSNDIENLLIMIVNDLRNKQFDDINNIYDKQFELQETIKRLKREQIVRIKKGETSKRNSVLFLNTLTETKNMILYVINVLQAQIDFNVYVYQRQSIN